MEGWDEVSGRQYQRRFHVRGVVCMATVTSYGENGGPSVWLLRYAPVGLAPTTMLPVLTGRVWLGALGNDAARALEAAATEIRRAGGTFPP